MSTPAIDYDALAAQHGGSVQVDYDALAAQHGGTAVGSPQHDWSSLTANPKGEGTYQIQTPDKQTVSVPYSNVPVFQNFRGTSFATPAEQARFEKDANADPNRPTYWNELKYDVDNAAQTEPYDASKGVAGNAKTAMNNLGAGAVQALLEPVIHPVNTVKAIVKGLSPSLPTPGGGTEDIGGYTPPSASHPSWGQTGADLTAMIPGAVLGKEVAPALAEKAAPIVADAGASAAEGARRFVAGDVNAPINETGLTPAQRYASMSRVGVQPNAAEATNSAPLNMAEKVNQNSLGATQIYAKARAANLAALNRFTNDVLGSMSPLAPESGGVTVQHALVREQAEALAEHNALADRVLDHMSPLGPEEGGAAVQQGLRDAQTNLQNNAAEGFSELDRQVGGRLLSGQTLQQTAKNIYDANADYYAKHPSLVPGNAWKIVKDLAGADTAPPFQARAMRFPEVHQLRTDLLEMVRSNPDIVKNQAGGWLQQLANAADRTMTTGATGLSPEGVRVFRNANEAWANMKGTYDNPSHPFYQAVRSPAPSTLVNGISKAPEMAKTLQEALGAGGIGPIQRGVAEKLLGTAKEGGYDFKNFQASWNKLPQAYREALFTPWQNSQLERLAGQTASNPFYDPQSVLYKAVNAQDPSTLVKGVVQTPEAIRQLQGVLGPEGIGPIQRGVAESLLKTTKEGGYNFKTFQGQWNRLPEAYRNALFTPEQIQKFRDIGNAGTVLHEDLNPSGTAKLGQKQAEMLEGGSSLGALATGHPAAAIGTGVYHAAQFALAKAMNSPTFVDWLMRDGETGWTGSQAAPGSLGEASQAWASNSWQRSKAGFDALLAEQNAKAQQPVDNSWQRSKAEFDALRAEQNAKEKK